MTCLRQSFANLHSSSGYAMVGAIACFRSRATKPPAAISRVAPNAESSAAVCDARLVAGHARLSRSRVRFRSARRSFAACQLDRHRATRWCRFRRTWAGPIDPEAINYLAAVVSGSLVGLDMRSFRGQDWVTIGTNFFNADEGVYVNSLCTTARANRFGTTFFPMCSPIKSMRSIRTTPRATSKRCRWRQSGMMLARHLAARATRRASQLQSHGL